MVLDWFKELEDIEGESLRDLVKQISYFVEWGKGLSEIEVMEGIEAWDWDLLQLKIQPQWGWK